MKPKTPHKVFSILWGIWYLCIWIALLNPQNPKWALSVLVAFLPLETAALIYNNPKFKDTLSEIVSWVWQKLSKHSIPLRGWNAMMFGVIFTITYLLGRTLEAFTESFTFSWILSVILTVWLYDHWSDPQKHG